MTESVPIAPTPASALRLTPLPRLAHGPKWRMEAMRSYRAPVLYWITRGQGRVTISGVTRGFGAHNAVFVPAGAMHGIETVGQLYGTQIAFAASFDRLGELSLPQDPRHLRVRDVTAQAEFSVILEALERELKEDRPAADRALHHHIGLLSVWLERQLAAAQDTTIDTAPNRLARRYAAMIEKQLYTGQTVTDYAEALGVTPTHLTRVCRESCQRTASELLTDRLMFEARRLLSDTPMTVRRISEVLGYGSAGYFTRAFQKRTGISPSAFRERQSR